MRFLWTFPITLLLMVSAVSAANDPMEPSSALSFVNVSQEHGKDRIVEFWGYHDYQGSGDHSDTLRLRYYEPLQLDRWQGMLRLDTSYVSSYGSGLPNQNPGQYSAGSTFLTMWGGMPDWSVNLGARVVLPIGGSNQWAIGPQISTSFAPAKQNQSILADFSPLVRYLYGFAPKDGSSSGGSPQNPLLRSLSTYPTLGFHLGQDTQLRLWDENGILYDTARGGWFVPLDAMVTHRVNQHFLFAIGASKQIVQTYQQYDWSIYGKLSFNF